MENRQPQKIRLGMVGGGLNSMIGEVHRYAARIDFAYDLVGGVFSSTRKKSLELNTILGLDSKRIYEDFETLFAEELKLPAAKRMEVISIVTPNDLHFPIAKRALEAGFHIILEKPLTQSLQEAKELQRLVKQNNNACCVLYTYCGYPMVKEAKHLVASKQLGQVRKIFVSFEQGWLAKSLENDHHKQAVWRTTPEKSGKTGTVADIGTHAFHLAEYITGLKATHLCADIHTIVPHRQLDDDGAIFLKYDNGAHGLLHVSQVATGEEDNIVVKIFCEKAGLVWRHQDPNTLRVQWLDKPTELLRTGKGNHYLSFLGKKNCRTPAGHVEGFLEAFANHYYNFAADLQARKKPKKINTESYDFPKIEEGVRGMAFIEAVVDSAHSQQKWVCITE